MECNESYRAKFINHTKIITLQSEEEEEEEEEEET